MEKFFETGYIYSKQEEEMMTIKATATEQTRFQRILVFDPDTVFGVMLAETLKLYGYRDVTCVDKLFMATYLCKVNKVIPEHKQFDLFIVGLGLRDLDSVASALFVTYRFPAVKALCCITEYSYNDVLGDFPQPIQMLDKRWHHESFAQKVQAVLESPNQFEIWMRA